MEGWPGLEDRSRTPHHQARKVDLTAMAAIRRLQANPEPGEIRVHAAFAQQGIDLSPRSLRLSRFAGSSAFDRLPMGPLRLSRRSM
jgi:hypothetical protein